MRLSNRASFYLQASIILAFLASSSAPTPLYSVYQAAWGFTPITITVVFGIYALAVLGSLLTLGSLSDYIGRKPVLLASTALQALTMLLFAFADSVAALILARVAQGIATGAAIGAIGAGMLDIDRAKGTVANAVAPMMGTALGGIGAGLMAQYLPWPTHLVFFALFGIMAVQTLGVMFMPESCSPKPGALASLEPRFSMPPLVRQPIVFAAPVIIAIWALLGFYGSLGPTLVRALVGSDSLALGGLVVMVVAGSGALTVLFVHARPARGVMLLGAAALAGGVALTLLSIGQASAWLMFSGMAVAGVGVGAGMQGAIRTVIPLAAPHERAGVLSIVYVIAYLAMGLPAVLGGVSVVYGGGVLETAREYGLGVIALALFALLGTALRREPAAATAPAAVDARAT
jgi:predicted MFS family arabinose efflux permease